MSEKLKPNFTPVPNVIFDEALRGLSSGAVKVLFAICRYTYGWGKQSDRISLKQLSEMTGIKDRGNVYRAIKQLGNLLTIKPGDPSRNQASEHALNIEIPDSDLLSLQQQNPLSLRQQPVVRPVVKTPPIQRNPKKEDNSSRKNRARNSASDPRVKTLLTAFSEKYEARVGSPAKIGGKEAKSLKALLTAGYDVPAIEAVMDRYFANKFYSETGFDAAVFANAFNRLNSAGATKQHNYEEGMFPAA